MWFLRLNSCAKCNFRVSMGKGRSSLSLSLRHVYFYIKIERFSSVGGSAERVGAFSPAAITFPRAIVFVLPSSTIVRVLDPLWSRLWVSSMRPEVVRIDMLQELDQGVGVIIVLSFLFEHPRFHAIFHARFDADRCVFRTFSIRAFLLSDILLLDRFINPKSIVSARKCRSQLRSMIIYFKICSFPPLLSKLWLSF